MKKKIVAVSGGFDPIHVGHVRMIREAAEYGDVVVIANSDEWLKRKKGYVFMAWDERAEIIESIKGVIAVYQGIDDDDTVCENLKSLQPDEIGNIELNIPMIENIEKGIKKDLIFLSLLFTYIFTFFVLRKLKI